MDENTDTQEMWADIIAQLRSDREECRREIEQRQSELEAVALDVVLGKKDGRTLRAKEKRIRDLEARIAHLDLALVEAERRWTAEQPAAHDAQAAGPTAAPEQSNSTGEQRSMATNTHEEEQTEERYAGQDVGQLYVLIGNNLGGYKGGPGHVISQRELEENGWDGPMYADKLMDLSEFDEFVKIRARIEKSNYERMGRRLADKRPYIPAETRRQQVKRFLRHQPMYPLFSFATTGR